MAWDTEACANESRGPLRHTGWMKTAGRRGWKESEVAALCISNHIFFLNFTANEGEGRSHWGAKTRFVRQTIRWQRVSRHTANKINVKPHGDLLQPVSVRRPHCGKQLDQTAASSQRKTSEATNQCIQLHRVKTCECWMRRAKQLSGGRNVQRLASEHCFASHEDSVIGPLASLSS